MDVGSSHWDIDVRQQEFDPLGPTVKSSSTANGRVLNYIDEGDPSWTTLLFFGGAGTSVRSFGLMEFARTLREQLRIRVISVERNGLGQTTFDPDYDVHDYANDVWDLLDFLNVANASIAAVSGGGPYAAWVARAQPKRVRSIHLACVWAQANGTGRTNFDLEAAAGDPVAWWEFPSRSSVRHIAGFVDSTIEEATRAAFTQGANLPPAGLEQAFTLYSTTGLPNLNDVDAPAFLYWGSDDSVVPLDHLGHWTKSLACTPLVRLYHDEGHDTQYRHWDQILTDVAYLGERIIVCHEGHGALVPPMRAKELLDDGATLGLCAWT